ncbi:MAG: chloride channel protein [Chthoniobacterales bacterium]|nr:chloride channel protein [Chthoniobacterales bacterium]
MKNESNHSTWRALGAALIGAVLAGLGALLFVVFDQQSTKLSRVVWEAAPWAVFIIMPLGFAMILWLRDHVFPGTDGTGIPQTIAVVSAGPGELRDRLLSMRVAFGKALLLGLGMFSFLSIGREGPSVQIGACFMNLVSKWAVFPRHLMERGLILAGGAAGIAAAFNAPIAGIVFAFEEIGRRFDKENLGTIVRTVMVACLVCVVFLGNYFFYGRIDYDRLIPLEFMSPGPWVAVLIIGLAGGLLGGLFAKVLLVLVPYVSRMIRRRFLAVAVITGLACAALAWTSDGATLGTGYDQARALIVQDSPQYLATLPPEEVARLAATRENTGPWYALQRAAVTMMVLLTGIPGGLFDPSFSIGAGLGHLTAPWLAVTGATMQGIILLWVVSYFSGVVQSPMTAFIILIEMTGAVAFTLPLGLASIVAYEASRRVCPVALYEALAENFLRSGRAAGEGSVDKQRPDSPG